MHHAAAHRDGAMPVADRAAFSCAHKCLCDSGVKAGSDSGFADSALQIVQQFMPQGRDLEQ